MWQLSTALCTNNVLEELILSRDNLVSPAGAAIAAFLKENNSIKVLDLQVSCSYPCSSLHNSIYKKEEPIDCH